MQGIEKVNGILPAESFQAVVSDREVKLDALGAPAILLLHTADSADQAGEINKSLRQEYQDIDQLLVINVVHLKAVPRPFRRVAEGAMRKSYDEASTLLPEGFLPEDCIIMLPDWEGSVTEFAGFEAVDREVGLLAVGEERHSINRYQGPDALAAAQEMAKQLIEG